MAGIELVLDGVHQRGPGDGTVGAGGRHDRRGSGQHHHAAPRLRRVGARQPLAHAPDEPGRGVVVRARVQAGVQQARPGRPADHGPDSRGRARRGQRVEHVGQPADPERDPDHGAGRAPGGQRVPPAERHRGQRHGRRPAGRRDQLGHAVGPVGHALRRAFEQYAHPQQRRRTGPARPLEFHRRGHQRGTRRGGHRRGRPGPVRRPELPGDPGHRARPRVQPERDLGDQPQRALASRRTACPGRTRRRS